MHYDKFLDQSFTFCTQVLCVMGTMPMLYTGKMCQKCCNLPALGVINYSV